MKRLAYPSTDSLIEVIKSGAIINIPITEQDVKRSEIIYGNDVASLKGKSTRAKDPTYKFEYSPIPLIQNQSLHFDIMFLEGQPFLNSISQPLCLLMSTYLKDGRTSISIEEAMVNQIKAYEIRKFVIAVVNSDGEGGIQKIATDLALIDDDITNIPIINIVSPGQHVGQIERKNRQIKERCRSVLSSLPYILVSSLLVYLVGYVVQRINMFPTKSKLDRISPAESFLGRKIDFLRDLRFEFGEYVQMNNPNITPLNSMQVRTEGGIALMASGNAQGSVKFFCLGTKKVVTRSQWKVLPIPNEVIEYMNNLAKDSRLKNNNEPFAILQPLQEDDDIEVQNINDEPRIIIEQEEIINNDNNDTNETINNNNNNHNINNNINNNETINNNNNDMHDNVPDEEIEVLHKHYTRSSRPDPISAYLEHGLHFNEHLMHLSHKRAEHLFGAEATKESLLKEATQMLQKKVWKPQSWSALSAKKKQFNTLPCFTFYKDKWFPNGDFEKLKGRSAVNGSKQNRENYKDLYSPTAATASVFFVATVAAVEKRFVLKFDIPGAYLNTDLEAEIYIIIDQQMADIIKELDNTFAIGLRSDGKMVVKLMKGQYGLIESAQLWYMHIKNTLEDLGFQTNPIDGSVFNCIRDGKQITIVIHVDDGMITSDLESNIEWVKKELTEKYGTLSLHEGNIIPYTGMTFDFSEKGHVSVSMEKYIDDIRQWGVKGVVRTPASNNLFHIDTMSKPLNFSELQKFHSRVMKLMWLAKRCAPEILCAVSFLSTRVQTATENDMEKLERICKYLNNDIKFEIRFGNNEIMGSIVMDTFIDVSYAVHADFKSHTGEVVRVNNGPIHVSSTKQKINSKSTAEAELIGLSDQSGTTLMYRDFAAHQGYKLGAIKIYQDNKSTIALINKGHSTSQRTRHINIKYFYLKDRITENEIKVEYIESKKMLADILTKPLQGALFEELKNKLCNKK